MYEILFKAWLVFIIFSISITMWRISRFVKFFRGISNSKSTVEKLEMTVESQIKNRFLAATIKRDLLIIYYMFTRKAVPNSEYCFSLYKKIGYGGITLGFVFVLVLEGVGLSYFLHKWNPIIAWVHIILSFYMIFFMISDYRAIKLNPVKLLKDKLIIRIGFREKAIVCIKNIDKVQSGRINFEADKKNKNVWNATILGFEDSDFEIILTKNVTIQNGIGQLRSINKIYLSLDEKDKFLSTLHSIQAEHGIA